MWEQQIVKNSDEVKFNIFVHAHIHVYNWITSGCYFFHNRNINGFSPQFDFMITHKSAIWVIRINNPDRYISFLFPFFTSLDISMLF